MKPSLVSIKDIVCSSALAIPLIVRVWNRPAREVKRTGLRAASERRFREKSDNPAPCLYSVVLGRLVVRESFRDVTCFDLTSVSVSLKSYVYSSRRSERALATSVCFRFFDRSDVVTYVGTAGAGPTFDTSALPKGYYISKLSGEDFQAEPNNDIWKGHRHSRNVSTYLSIFDWNCCRLVLRVEGSIRVIGT
jgi:hypothetical protein